jgi:D-alanyl-D-alanine carboxypeptidase
MSRFFVAIWWVWILGLAPRTAHAQCRSIESVRDAPDIPTPVEVQVGVGPGPTEQQLKPHQAAILHAALDDIVAKSGAVSAGAAVIVPDVGRWSATYNAAPEQVFSVGSIGKAATAALILDDVAKGRISLADPISRWFPYLRGASDNTIDHLLTHHSGYQSFNRFRALQGRLPPERPQQLVRFAARRSGTACPGHELLYSNTNYVLLGLIVEQEHDHLLHEIEAERILTPLGLYRSRAMERAMPPPELLAGHDPDGRTVTSMDYGAPHGAGNLAMTPRELATFWHALLAGQVVSPVQVERMLDGWTRMPAPPDTPEMYYGRGTMLIRSPDGNGWLVGHTGGIRGFSAMVAWSTSLDAVLAVTLSGSNQSEAAFWALHQALAQALNTVEPQ